MTAIHHAMTTACTIFAASLNLGTEKILRYKERTESLIVKMAVP